MFIQTVHNSLFRALEKDRNDVPVVKERTGTAFRLETNTGYGSFKVHANDVGAPVLYSFALANYESRS